MASFVEVQLKKRTNCFLGLVYYLFRFRYFFRIDEEISC